LHHEKQIARESQLPEVQIEFYRLRATALLGSRHVERARVQVQALPVNIQALRPPETHERMRLLKVPTLQRQRQRSELDKTLDRGMRSDKVDMHIVW
jgi:hypothetical protein